MGWQQRQKQEEYAQLNGSVNRAIATLIHSDLFLSIINSIYKESMSEDGTLDLSGTETQSAISHAISLFASLQNGTYQKSQSLLESDIKLIARYNNFDYNRYVEALHKTITEDEEKEEPEQTKL